MAIFNKTTEDQKQSVPATTSALAQHLQGILIQPRVSEKAGNMSKAGKYVFQVANSANKISVKKAIEQTYKVKVVQVNMITNKGKNRTFGKTSGRTSDFKKAIVTLKEGDRIEGVTETV